MGILDKLSKKTKKVNDKIKNTLDFTELLQQLKQDYEQGFLSDVDYDFKNGLYDKWNNTGKADTPLHVVEEGTLGLRELEDVSFLIA